MTLAEPRIELSVWKSDALMIFDWLMSTDLNMVPIRHPAQKQALMDLLVQLEMEPTITGASRAQIDDVQAEVVKDTGWQRRSRTFLKARRHALMTKNSCIKAHTTRTADSLESGKRTVTIASPVPSS